MVTPADIQTYLDLGLKGLALLGGVSALGLGAKNLSNLGAALADLMDHFVHNPGLEKEIATLVRFAEQRITDPAMGFERYKYVKLKASEKFPGVLTEKIDHKIEAAVHDLPQFLTAFTSELEKDAAKEETKPATLPVSEPLVLPVHG